jgi:hypothetical protein
MTLAFWYWILMLIGLMFGFWRYYEPSQPFYRNWGGHILEFLLFAIAGWKLFGNPFDTLVK